MIWKTLTILVLIAAIAGGTWYFVYEFHLKPKKLDVQEKLAVAEAASTPPPDPAIAAFEALKPQLELNTPEAVAAIHAYLQSYPESAGARDARAALGRINAAAFFAPVAGLGKVEYSVVSGDSLVKIASKFKTSAELIYRVNGLTTINLKIGQPLLVPQIDTSLVIDRGAQSVTVRNNGEFFKEYTPLSFKLPPSVASGKIETKVNDKFMMKGSDRLAFGSKDYETGDRWIMLGTGGLALRSLPAPPTEGTPPPPPPGIVFTPEEAAEIFVLVTRGTPVIIQ